MNRPPAERWEELVRQTASAFPYPPTPDVSGTVAARLDSEHTRGEQAPTLRLRPVWALVIILALIVGLLAVPPVRAAILEFLQIGAVRIWLVEPTPTATPTPAPTEPNATPTATPRATPTPLRSLLDLSGETTLAGAQNRVPFPIRLPTYPADLGTPDQVFVQNLDGAAVILVWLAEEQPEQVQMSLHLLTSDIIAWKMEPKVVTEATVNNQPAVWAEGPYVIVSRNGAWDNRRLVQGHVLIWTEGKITYRLETELPLEEAVRVAESLQ